MKNMVPKWGGRDGVMEVINAGVGTANPDYLMGRRNYSAVQARFRQVDPLPGQAGTADTAYSYAGNEPVNQIDPDGEQCVTGASSGPVYSSDGNGHGKPSITVDKRNNGNGDQIYVRLWGRAFCNDRSIRLFRMNVDYKANGKWSTYNANGRVHTQAHDDIEGTKYVTDSRDRRAFRVYAQVQRAHR